MASPLGGTRVPIRDLLTLAVAALVARATAAVVVGDAPYLDPGYYELVARRLVEGEGFSIPVLWSFLEVGAHLPADAMLPVPSNGHWMPLTSIVAAGSMLLFGESTLAARLPMVLLGVFLVVLTALVAWELWASRRVTILAGTLAIFAGPLLVLSSQVDNFVVFGAAGALAIYAAMRAARPAAASAGLWLVASGAAVGLATLARVDGLLLATAPIVAWLSRSGMGPRSRSVEPISLRWAFAAALIAGAVLAPWMLRQAAVFGSPLPSAGGHTLWITGYNEQFSIGHVVGPAEYLAWGLPAIVGSKLVAWGLLLGRTAVLLGGIFIASFAYGLWTERRRPELAPFSGYFVVMFVTMGLVFTFHAPNGAYYHSAFAWLPFAIPLGLGAFEPMIQALGRRWSLLSRPRNRAFLANAAVVGAVILSVIGSVALVAGWRADRALLDRAVPFFTEARSGDTVMYVDPPALYLATGNPAVAPPFDPYPIIEDVVRAYGVKWVLLERQPGQAEDALGLWQGSASVDADGNRATWLEDQPVFEASGVRIYAVQAP